MVYSSKCWLEFLSWSLSRADQAFTLVQTVLDALFSKLTNLMLNDRIENLTVVDEERLMRDLTEGQWVGFSVNSIGEINPRPDWLDEQKLKRGQRFALEYFPNICLAGVISLYLLFPDESTKSLIFTNKSSTVLTSSRRYLSTIARVKSWYQCDLLDTNSPGYKNLERVFHFHLTTFNKINPLPENERAEKTSLQYWIGSNIVKSSMCPFVREDSERSGITANRLITSPIFISQVHMSATLFGFMGLVVLFPRKFGVSSEGLEDFVHLWRYIGHMLGIQDKYNICSGSLKDVKNNMTFILERALKPSLCHVDQTWEHMSRVMTDGVSLFTPKITFEVCLVYLLRVIGINTSKLTSQLTWYQFFLLLESYFLLRVMLTFKFVRNKSTKFLLKQIDKSDSDFSSIVRKYNALNKTKSVEQGFACAEC